jgi:hypothetical protein
MTKHEYLYLQLQQVLLCANRLAVEAQGEDISDLNEVSNLLVMADARMEKLCSRQEPEDRTTGMPR